MQMTGNISELRIVLIELIKEFSRVCGQHEIKWYVWFGTLLGTMRQGGFLGCDDAVDIVMPKEDYERLCLHKEWFGESFFLQTAFDEGHPRTAKLRKNHTTAFSQGLVDSMKNGGHMGISISILPMDEIPGTSTFHIPALESCEKKIVYMNDWLEPAETRCFEGVEVRVPAQTTKVIKEIYDTWGKNNGNTVSGQRFWFYDVHEGYEHYVKRYTGLLDNIGEKKVFLFGAADSLRIWLERFDKRNQIVCTFDNDPNKWGKHVCGVEVCDPANLPGLMDDNSIIVIVSIWHQEIGAQLEKMGINDYYVYLDSYYDDKIGNEVLRRENSVEGESTIPLWRGNIKKKTNVSLEFLYDKTVFEQEIEKDHFDGRKISYVELANAIILPAKFKDGCRDLCGGIIDENGIFLMIRGYIGDYLMYMNMILQTYDLLTKK